MIGKKRGVYLKEWITQTRFSGSNGAKKRKLVALSFDDGPHRYNTPKVIEILKKNNAQATFFWIVENAINLLNNNPALFREIVSEIKNNNHEIGLHAPYDFKPTLSSRLYGKFSKYQLRKAKQTIENLTGMYVNLYRPHTSQLGSSIIYAKELRMETVIGDLLRFTKPDEEVYIQVKRLSNAMPGSILLLHDGQSYSQKTNYILNVLPQVINTLKDKGIKLTSVSKVLEN